MKKVAYQTLVVALFAIPFLPLVVAFWQFFPFITGKGFAFRILVEVALAAWVLLMIVDTKYRPKFSWLLVFYGGLVVWMFIANLLGMNPQKSLWSNFERMDGWVTLVHVFGFFLVSSTFLTAEKLWKKWWMYFIAGSAMVATYAVFQLLGVFEINQGGVRVDATFGNAAYLAAYLLFAIAVSIWQAVESKKKWLRYSLFALAAVHVLILFYTATRGAILGAIAGAFVAAGLMIFLGSGKNAKKYAAGTLGVLLVLVGAFFALRNTEWMQNDPTLGRLTTISLAEGSTRFQIWNIAYQGFLDRPVFGWGQESFNYVFNTYYSADLYAQETWFDRAHDVYLDWLIAGGFPALTLFLLLLGGTALTILRSKTMSRTERIALLSALSAYALQAVFVFDNLFTYVPMAAIFAIAHASSARNMQKVDSLPVAHRATFEGRIVPVVAVVSLVVIWVVNVPNITAAHKLVVAASPYPVGVSHVPLFEEALKTGTYARQEIREHAVQHALAVVSNQDIPAQVKAETAQFALAQITDEVRRNPHDVRMYYYLSLAHRLVGNQAAAIDALNKGIALSPEKQMLYFEKGMVAMEMKDIPLAVETFEAAYDINPENPQAVMNLAAAKMLSGKGAEADAILLEKFGTTTVDNPMLIRAYYETARWDAFVEVWQQRVKSNNGDPEYRFALVSAYVAAGRTADAIEEIQTTMREHPEKVPQGSAMLRQLTR